jgi:hypothetical protein
VTPATDPARPFPLGAERELGPPAGRRPAEGVPASRGAAAAGAAAPADIAREFASLALRDEAARVSETESKARTRNIRRWGVLLLTLLVLAVTGVAIVRGGELPFERHFYEVLDRVGLERPEPSGAARPKGSEGSSAPGERR